MPVPKILLIAVALIAVVEGYRFITYEKEAYTIRKAWEREREEGMKRQAGTKQGERQKRKADTRRKILAGLSF